MQNAHIENGPVQEVTGVILAGGGSKRLGRDKATLEIEGVTLFDRVLAALQRAFPRVLIAGDRPDLVRPGVPFYPDRYPGSALGGLFTGLEAAPTPWILVAPCDLPFPDLGVIQRLLERRQGWDAVVPRTRRGLEPLFALYAKSCLDPMRARLESGNLRIIDLLPELQVRYVEEAELPDGWERSLINLNTPEDVSRLGQWR